MGALGVGYLAGSGSGSHVQTIPRNYPTVPAEAPAPLPPPSPVDPAATPPPPEPIPDRSATDGLSEYPAWNGVDLDCSDIRHRVRVTGPDPHRLDQDGNGIGCESY
ncbi:MAG TPA: hypothetical protein VFT45_07720 [Longimicrobium sp.]|nr:hypothetical protein [Longimicrobium sp.]